MTVERLWLAAWLEGLREVSPLPAVRLVELPPRRIPLDDTGRAPTVPLRPDGGDDA
jgi:hypothetical protein